MNHIPTGAIPLALRQAEREPKRPPLWKAVLGWFAASAVLWALLWALYKTVVGL